MSTSHLSEQELIRRDKLAELNQLGIDAYPAPLFPVNINAAYIKENYKEGQNNADFADVTLAGRIVRSRDMGKASFADLQDSTGRIQMYVKRDDLPWRGQETL
jgi:lysyl-tRNA synthetase class 2